MPLNNQNQMITEKKYTINTRIENENYNLFNECRLVICYRIFGRISDGLFSITAAKPKYSFNSEAMSFRLKLKACVCVCV